MEAAGHRPGNPVLGVSEIARDPVKVATTADDAAHGARGSTPGEDPDNVALVWTGRGRMIPKIVPRKGSVMHREAAEKLPSGFGKVEHCDKVLDMKQTIPLRLVVVLSLLGAHGPLCVIPVNGNRTP